MPRLRVALPALLVVVVVAAALGRPVSAASPGTCTPDASWGTAQPELAQSFLALVNAYRGQLGLSQLVRSPTLDAAATWKAAHMAGNGYFGHNDPGPPVARTWAERILACGYTGDAYGENIAYGYRDAAAVMGGWLDSPSHRANIERAIYNATGVAVFRASSGRIYWVQEFGSVVDTATDAPAPLKAAPPLESQPPPPVPPKLSVATKHVAQHPRRHEHPSHADRHARR